MPEWRVVIVEDDAGVALVHRQVVARMAMFEVVGVAESAEQALEQLRASRPHLLLLDLSLPGADGVSLLRRLRAARMAVEVIAVTASRDPEAVRAMVHLGVVDYLVKPFPPERLRQALGFFLRRMAALGGAEMGQEQIDALCSSGRRAGRALPKGLVGATLEEVRRHVAVCDGARSAGDVGRATGMSRVTARRYLEDLLAPVEVTVALRGPGPGRPRRLYRAVAAGAP